MPNNKKKFKQDPSATISSFSKNLLGLKFMQRAKKEVEIKAVDKDESFDSFIGAKIKNKQQYIINPSYQFCERLRFGRFSFKGMNADIETIMYNNKPELEPVKSGKREAPPSESSSDNEIDNLESNEEEDDEDDFFDSLQHK